MTKKIKENTFEDKFAGKKVKFYRVMKSISRAVLAKKIGVTGPQVRLYELGKNRMTIGRLCKISEFLEVNVTNFFDPKIIAKKYKNFD